MIEQQRSAAFWILLNATIDRIEEMIRSYRLMGICRFLTHEKRIGKFKITISVEVLDD